MPRLKRMESWFFQFRIREDVFFSLSKTFCLILLTTSLGQTKTVNNPINLRFLEKSNSNKVVQPVEIVKNVLVKVPNICKSSFYASNLYKYPNKDLLALSDEDIDEKLIFDILASISKDFLNSKTVPPSPKSYSAMKDLLEKNEFLFKPKEYKSDHELYDKIWNSFTWRDLENSFSTTKDALDFITEIYYVSNPQDRMILREFFSQSLYFDNIPRYESLDPKFSGKMRLSMFVKSLKPRGLTIIEAIEEAQNMISWRINKFSSRILTVSTLNLQKCRSIKQSLAFPATLMFFETPSTQIPSTSTPWFTKTTTSQLLRSDVSETEISAQNPPNSTKSVNKGKDCGRLIQHQSRIVGGHKAAKNSWPWMAALMLGDSQFCGGALISDMHVLTASHCVDGLSSNVLKIRLGEYDFSQQDSGRLECQVERVIMHEFYSSSTFMNDIALIKLKEKISFNNDHLPICLPPSNIALEGKNAKIAGWGLTSYEGQRSKVLLEATLPIWKNTDCSNALETIIKEEQQVCAGLAEGGVDACQGDSGGPLMFETTPGQWTTVGIVSWGIKCAERDKPGVYTRVSAYLDWINAKLLL